MKQSVQGPRKIETFGRSLLKVILMPHSHNDPGWVKTLDTYYQGQTKKILNVIVDNLHGHPKRKFVWAETIFLNMWFNDPNVDDARKQKFRDLLKNKAWFQNRSLIGSTKRVAI